MFTVRRAKPEEESLVKALESKLDLAGVPLSFNETWVVEEEGGLIGLARLSDLGEAYFLSSVGILPEKRRLGLARQLLQTMLANRDKDVYLYTVIPEFFLRLGFVSAFAPPFLPPKELFDCHLCQPERCCCLVKRKETTGGRETER